MSRLQNKAASMTESKPMKYDSNSAPTDYKIQHPLAAFKHAPVQTDKDHLHQYTEVSPFEDAEWSARAAAKKAKEKLKKAAKAAKKAGSAAARAAKKAGGKATNAVGKFVGSRQLKKDVKKVEKLVDKIEVEEKKIYKLRKKQKDTEAFDEAVKAKLDPAEEEIYAEALN